MPEGDCEGLRRACDVWRSEVSYADTAERLSRPHPVRAEFSTHTGDFTVTQATLRLAIIGAGGRGINCFGQMVGRRDDARITALVDPNPVRMRNACDYLGIEAVCYTALGDMLAREEVDGVFITSPDYTHEQNALAAIAAGVPTFVDKPLAVTATGCARIIEASEAADVLVAIGFNLRHVPLLAAVRNVIEAGEIGELMLIENREFYDGGRTYMSRWNRKYEWSGGLWVHKGCHDFDIFNWWNPGGIPVRVCAFGGVNCLKPEGIPFDVEEGKAVGPTCTDCAYAETCPDCKAARTPMFNDETAQVDGYHKDLCMYLSDKDTHDNGIALVEYDNNVRASHLECFICNFSDRLYTVVGDRGTIVANLESPSQFQLRPRWGQDRTIDVPPAPEGGHGGSDPDILSRYLTAIRTGAPHSSSPYDAIRSVAIGEAAELSWREHRTVEVDELVDLPRYRQPA